MRWLVEIFVDKGSRTGIAFGNPRMAEDTAIP